MSYTKDGTEAAPKVEERPLSIKNWVLTNPGNRDILQLSFNLFMRKQFQTARYRGIEKIYTSV